MEQCLNYFLRVPGQAMNSSFDAAFLIEMRRDLLRFARLQLRDDALAEDVVQEAIAGALSGGREFAGRSALKTWVFAILRNKIVDAIRERSRSINVSSLTDEEAAMDEAFDSLFKPNAHWLPNEAPAAWGDPEAALGQEQFWAVFEACLEHLPANTARVFMMREFLEFDTDEVCAELSISTSNCHVILHRARAGLRRCLERSWFADGGAPC
jgi:RNA polymerase sigma-70 factor (ECF subfamily)